MTMTKAQMKKRTRELLKKLSTLQTEIDDFAVDIYDEILDIEPYEGKDDLTDKQTERFEFFDDVKYELDQLCSDIAEHSNELSSKLGIEVKQK